MLINKLGMFRVFMQEDAEGAASTGVEPDTNQADSTTMLTAPESDADNKADDSGAPAETAGTTNDTGESSQTPPDTYADFTMPEGVPVDEPFLNEASSLFKEMNLNQDQAQKLVDAYAEKVQASSQSQVDAFNQLMSDWQEQSRNDKEFGGDKFDESIKSARSAVDKFGTPELKQLLEEHGVGNHPEVIRFMIKVDSMTREDVPGSTNRATAPAQDRVSLLYPNDRTA